jgi:hypothetical protein
MLPYDLESFVQLLEQVEKSAILKRSNQMPFQLCIIILRDPRPMRRATARFCEAELNGVVTH